MMSLVLLVLLCFSIQLAVMEKGNISVTHFVDFTLLSPIIRTQRGFMQTTTTKAIISRDNLMQYIHKDRDLLMGLQDDLSDMLSATGKFSITDDIVQNFMPHPISD